MSVAPKPLALTSRGFPKPVTEMSPEEKARADDIDLRCLSLCIGMLERVNGVRGLRFLIRHFYGSCELTPFVRHLKRTRRLKASLPIL